MTTSNTTRSVSKAAQLSSELKLGVFDPYGEFSNAPKVKIEHVFMPWVEVDLGSLTAAEDYARARGRDLLVTVEPLSWSNSTHLSPYRLRDDILGGKYDSDVRKLCAQFAKAKSPITVRWGHEMDMRNGRYPWSDWKPEEYAAAFRHFVTVCRSEAPHMSFMWSPRGEPGAGDYYPGNEFVDSIGLSIFGLQAYDQNALGGERSFAEMLEPSYDRVSKFGKPIFISEFGCAGDATYIERCIDFSPATLEKFPLLAGIVFFSEVDPGPWPSVYGTPDWRVSAQAVFGRK